MLRTPASSSEAPPAAGTRPLAVVTGASSGIGLALARRLATGGCDLLLIGRDAGRLADAAAEVEALGARAQTAMVDLADAQARAALGARLAAAAPDILVNNAGVGASGSFAEIGPARAAEMVATNVSAVMELCAAVLPAMQARGSGRILNVASTGAFAPLPYAAVYGATKAFVLSFSESLASELKRSGVTVTVLCPGPTPTRFFERAGMENTRLFTAPMTSPERVAEAGYRAMMAGQRLRVVGIVNRLLVFTLRLGPRALVVAVVRRMMKPRADPDPPPA